MLAASGCAGQRKGAAKVTVDCAPGPWKQLLTEYKPGLAQVRYRGVCFSAVERRRVVPDGHPEPGILAGVRVFMKRMVAAVLAAVLMMALGAVAQEPPRRPYDRFDRDGRGDGGPGAGRPPAREAAWPGPHGSEGGPGGHGRMSPEERKQLRRDINAHGRDIYRERGQR